MHKIKIKEVPPVYHIVFLLLTGINLYEQDHREVSGVNEYVIVIIPTWIRCFNEHKLRAHSHIVIQYETFLLIEKL